MKKLPRFLILFGCALIASGFLVLGLTFGPVVREEIRYDTTPRPTHITPVNTQFGIVIPKIGANARVIINVNPYDAKEYQQALTRGVAHAKGSSLPGENGTIFLFSHSSVDFYLASQYNSVFYLINKLERGDEIDLYYQTQKYIYRITDKKIVGSGETSYINNQSNDKQLILMTCWPPGTSFERLIVIAVAGQ
jgi:sortase A